ncbi:hypothetical protein LB553_27910 [Mesorhizobium sp. CA8]|uniref:aldose epimerase family protein n=1 Tax=Mesorhizobium sp. CA8 TaxID=2876637 RepID=UPI001CCAF913|nr:hypothetical protein [Mesorhizobium sp. CA8]MBZ9764664.1 hypothetical protein [Mesorhizobium sp. CA8]
MADIEIASDRLRCVLSTQGGLIWRLEAKSGDAWHPLLRPPPEGSDRNPLKAGCFPLVPFGNRVEGNRLLFDRTEYRLKPNTPWDKHYLHGDGWLGNWTVEDRCDAEASLSFEFQGEPYRYRATQRFKCEGVSFRAILGVTNLGERPMPFGLGWHPFFPLTPATTLQAPAVAYWTEKAGWLPDARIAIPENLDSAKPKRCHGNGSTTVLTVGTAPPPSFGPNGICGCASRPLRRCRAISFSSPTRRSIRTTARTSSASSR